MDTLRTLSTLAVLTILLGSLAGVATGGPLEASPPTSRFLDPDLGPVMGNALENISQDFVHSSIENLTAFGTRYAHSVQNPKAAHWIYRQFEAYGYRVEKWNFTHQGNNKLSNIIATKEGTDPSSDGYLIVCAHLDSTNWPESWSFPETPAPGADDDATGIATLLSAARALQNHSFRHDIRFIAFNAEELAKAVGSTRYAENASLNGDNIIGVLNVDMIGYNDHFLKMDLIYDPQAYHLYTDHINPVNQEFDLIEHLYAKEDPHNENTWGDADAFQAMGVDAISFVESISPTTTTKYYRANENYHTENDTIDTLNMDLVTRGAKLVTGTLISMAEPVLPDLEIPSISAPGGLVFEGEPMVVNATVRNSGDLNATDVEVELRVDGAPHSSVDINVSRGQSRNLSFEWNATVGTHDFGLKVDPGNVVVEINESNNFMSINKTVIQRPDISLTGLRVDEDTVSEGQMVNITVRAFNEGPTDVGCSLEVWDRYGQEENLASEQLHLDPDQEWERTYQWRAMGNGTHRIEAGFLTCTPKDRNLTNNDMNDTVTINGVPVARMDIAPTDGGDTLEDLDFSAADSSDDGTVEAFRFDFGDGNSTDWLDVPFASHNYTDDGVYTASLTVRDDLGRVSDVVERNVYIRNRPPEARAYVDRPVVETLAPVTFYSNASGDMDGTIVSYNWSFQPGGMTSTKANPTMVFPIFGEYTARLIVTDDDGAVASTSISVSITNRRPVAGINAPDSVMVGETVYLSGSGSEDQDGEIRSYIWDFGDDSGSSERDPIHVYRQPGNYTVELRVRDNHGGVDVTTHVISVEEAPEEPDRGISDRTETFLVIVVMALLLLALVQFLREMAFAPASPGTGEGGIVGPDRDAWEEE